MVFISPKIFIHYFFCQRTMSLFHIYLFTPTFLLLCAKDHLGLRLCAHALPAPSMANNHWNAGVVSCQWLRVSSQCSSGLPPTGVPTKGCGYQRVCLPTGDKKPVTKVEILNNIQLQLIQTQPATNDKSKGFGQRPIPRALPHNPWAIPPPGLHHTPPPPSTPPHP